MIKLVKNSKNRVGEMKIIENMSFDGERAFYGERDIALKNCRFDGERDGESAFKEGGNIAVEDCFFNLRYPFWHNDGVKISSSEMSELCRAALWYSTDISVKNTKLHGIKALRECERVEISDSDVCSAEFGWFCSDVRIENTSAIGEYMMLRTRNLTLENFKLNGKYSFQYIENASLDNCLLNTKDAFWHAKDVTVRNSVINGEYLGWYSENLTLENCVITGTQPLCYCKGLKLINCEMHDCDLAFELSDVEAEITTPIISVKNAKSGKISIPAVCEIIDDAPYAKCEIVIE